MSFLLFINFSFLILPWSYLLRSLSEWPRGAWALYNLCSSVAMFFSSCSTVDQHQQFPNCAFSAHMVAHWSISFSEATILLVRRRGSRSLARCSTWSLRFTDFPSLCACPESSRTNLIGSGLNLLCLQSHSKPECRWTWPRVPISSAWQKGPLGARLPTFSTRLPTFSSPEAALLLASTKKSRPLAFTTVKRLSMRVIWALPVPSSNPSGHLPTIECSIKFIDFNVTKRTVCLFAN